MALSTTGCALIYDSFGGAFRGEPAQMLDELSPGARQLLDDAFAGIDPDALGDYHVHLISRDIHPDWITFRRPALYWRAQVYFSASGVRWSETVEEDYVERLLDLIDHFAPPGVDGPGRFYLYALDWARDADGSIDHDRSPIHVSNEFMMQIAQRRPDVFVPVISVHPYRDDAVDELMRYADMGARHVKWIPSAMGINPASPRIRRYYEVMVERDMVLLSHTGHQESIRVVEHGLANPLLLRKPLDMGVKVVALHSASDGDDVDFDDPKRRRRPSFELFMRMMDEERYDGLLFGEASTMIFFNHLDEPLLELLERQDLHHRWVNGSDYPLCALNIVIQPAQLARLGLITRQEARYLNEIYNYNPLLFDFVVKRTVRHPKTAARLDAELFHVPPAIR